MLVAVDDCLRTVTVRFDDTPGRAVVARAGDKPASMSFRAVETVSKSSGGQHDGPSEDRR